MLENLNLMQLPPQVCTAETLTLYIIKVTYLLSDLTLRIRGTLWSALTASLMIRCSFWEPWRRKEDLMAHYVTSLKQLIISTPMRDSRQLDQ